MVEQVGRPDTHPQTQPLAQLEAELEAELASFASLSAGTGNGGVHPDQLDLLTLIDDLDHDSLEQQ
jgi:hypothetical protein